jgi:hypothetical protein
VAPGPLGNSVNRIQQMALMDMAPHQTGRDRVLMSLGVAELAGIVASVVVRWPRRWPCSAGLSPTPPTSCAHR